MFRWTWALPLFLAFSPLASAGSEPVSVALGLGSGQALVATEARWDGPEAAELRRVGDLDHDGSFDRDEVRRFEERYSIDGSQLDASCVLDYRWLVLDGRPAARLLNVTVTTTDAAGATSSEAPLTLRSHVLLEFPAGSAGWWSVELRRFDASRLQPPCQTLSDGSTDVSLQLGGTPAAWPAPQTVVVAPRGCNRLDGSTLTPVDLRNGFREGRLEASDAASVERLARGFRVQVQCASVSAAMAAASDDGPFPSSMAMAFVAASIMLASLVFFEAPRYQVARWLGAPLFSRMARDEILDHPTRERIHQLIETEPGLTLAQLAKEAEVGHGTLLYHLLVLERHGFVESVRDGVRRRLFPKGFNGERPPLLHPAQKTILDIVARQPGIVQKGISAALRMERKAASYHVKTLMRLGLIEEVRRGRSRLYFRPRGTAMSETMAPAAAAAAPQ